MTSSITLTDTERAYVQSQPLGRLATVDVNGAPQNNPVGVFLDEETGDIVIGGGAMGASRKFRNVQANPQVALVIDDLVSMDPWTVRGLEIRGTAVALSDVDPPVPFMSREVIRITANWIVAWGSTRCGAEAKSAPELKRTRGASARHGASQPDGTDVKEHRDSMPLVSGIGLSDFLDALDNESCQRQRIGVGGQWSVLRMKGHGEPTALAGIGDRPSSEVGVHDNERGGLAGVGCSEPPRTPEGMNDRHGQATPRGQDPTQFSGGCFHVVHVLETHERHCAVRQPVG